MKSNSILLYPPLAINEIGKRENNEDAIFPPNGKAAITDTIFMVCDGVGGAHKGELASALICQHYPYFLQREKEKGSPITKKTIEQGVEYVEEKMRDFLHTNAECEGMASTLTLLCFYDNIGIVAWIGDSRVYHIRDAEILFKSKDHSLVNLLIDQGQISEEESQDHPQKNVILRAMNGLETAVVDTTLITDIQIDDYFVLCSDGILESVDEETLRLLLRKSKDPQQIIKVIQQIANDYSQDNYSLYLVKVKSVTPLTIEEKTNPARKNEKTISQIDKPEIKEDKLSIIERRKRGNNNALNAILLTVLFYCILFFLFYYFFFLKFDSN